LVEITLFERGVGHFERKSQGERGVPHQRFLASENYRVPGLSYGEKNAEKFNHLSRAHQRYRRQTTDGIATAISEREREFTSAKNRSFELSVNIDNFCRLHVGAMNRPKICSRPTRHDCGACGKCSRRSRKNFKLLELIRR